MRQNLLSFLLPLLVGLPGCAPTSAPGASAPESAAVVPAAEEITAERALARIEYLASDALRGRDTPSTGLEEAAAYLATEHRRAGLVPGGDNETFYQRFPFEPRRAGPAGAAPSFPPNVIAILPGSDPILRDEFVVLSAHFDHVGVGPPLGGDSIYNGADDNASGTTALLEVARALASLPTAPRRSVMFLHVSGEEHGLLGSEWYSENPTVPIDRVIANINVDMIGRNSPDSIVVIGKDYSSLGETVESIGLRHPELGLTVSDDLWPQERFFYRSDHYHFARKEIPALFFFAGVHEDYHRPSDHADLIDADKVARVSRLILYTVRELANDPSRPTWDPAGLAEVRALTR